MNPSPVRIGLLPLYLKLYDDCLPDRRAGCEAILREVEVGLRRRGAEVVSAAVARTAGETGAAVRALEAAGVDCLVTLHLAYSPSLESAPALARKVALTSGRSTA